MFAWLRKTVLAAALAASVAPAFAAAPPPVPALPDSERRTSYSIPNSSLCSCAVNFALYGDSTDYWNWVEVYINGVQIPHDSLQQGWTITSPTGPLSTIPRPITDAVLTFTQLQGAATIQIVGARRPRRVSQFPENAGVSARDFNQALTDMVAQQREAWDRTNDISGRTVRVPPGETLSMLAAVNTRANTVLGFDALGNTHLYSPASAVTAASNVNFLQGGTGAVSRTVQDELADTVKAAQFGAACIGRGDDSPAVQAAMTYANSVGGKWVELPAGVCEVNENVFLNTFATPGTLTVPGIKIRGQGRGVTILDSHVASDYVISANPAWKAAHKAAYQASTSTTGGTLATNTYYLQITENDGLGNEIVVTQPKSFSVTGPTGSISIPLPALNPGYSYNLYCDTVNAPVAHYCSLGGANASATAGNQTVTVTALGAAHTIPTTKQAVWQEVSIRDLSITNSSGTAKASGVDLFKVGYSDISRVSMKGLTGDGLDIAAYTGDNDGSFGVTVRDSKFDTIAGWCLNAAGAVLEFSNFVNENNAFNVCGTAPTNIGTAITVSAIPNNSSPVVGTATAHNFLAGDQIAFNVTGTTLASTWYRVGETVTSNTFNLVDQNGVAVNTTSLGAFVSGTVSLSWRPSRFNATTGDISGSGAVAYVGLISAWRNLGFTQNNNTNIYFSEAGSSDNATFEGIDMENTAGKGMYLASLNGGTWNNGECLSTVGTGSTISCVQLGTGYGAGGVQNFKMAWGGAIKVRNNVSPAIFAEQFQNTNIGATFQDTVRVGPNVNYQSFDAAGQTRYNGLVSDPVPGAVQFSISGANTAKLIPVGYGGTLPLHLKANGEWIPFHVPIAGITGAITGGLSATTQYNCFAHNSAAAGFPYALSFACNAHATALNQGYSVDSTDSTYTFIGTATTDGSGNFQSSGAQTSWYPPKNGPTVGTGITNGVAWFVNSALIGSTTPVNNAVLVTDGSGVPSESTTLPAAVQANITTLGIVGTGTWNGTAVTVPFGGTGRTTLTANAFLTGNGTGTVNQVAITGAVIGNGASAPAAYAGGGCSNQFITNLTASLGITCTGAVLASAQFANQGTTTTVLHGNAAGNPSWGAVNLSTDAGGTLQAAQEPAHTGDMTNTAGSLATTVSTVTGTTTNDSAASGKVGEYIQSSATNGTATVTISNASPAVITQTAHGLTAANNNCSAVNFTTTGGLPTGLVVGTNYYMTFVDANSYKVSTSVANCIAGTFVNTSSAGSGTHTVAHNAVLTTGSTIDVAGISLTAGDWDVTCTGSFVGGATTNDTTLVVDATATSSTLDQSIGHLTSFQFGASGVVPNAGFTLSCPAVRYSLSGTTTIFMDVLANFTVSTNTAFANIRARRAR